MSSQAAALQHVSETLLCCAHDLLSLCESSSLLLLSRLCSSAALEAGSACPEESLRALAAPVLSVTASLRALAAYPVELAAALLGRAAAAAAASVRAVPAALRMTAAAGGGGGSAALSAAAPAQHSSSSSSSSRQLPSPYVASILRPLRSVLSLGSGAHSLRLASSSMLPALLEPESALARALLARVACEACSALATALAATLAGLASQEASLQWLKKVQSATSAGASAAGSAGSAAGSAGHPDSAGALSETDRIGLQLALDVHALGKELGGAAGTGTGTGAAAQPQQQLSISGCLGLSWDAAALSLGSSRQPPHREAAALLSAFQALQEHIKPYERFLQR